MLARANGGAERGSGPAQSAQRKEHLQPAHSLPAPSTVSSNYPCPAPSPKAESFPEETVLGEQWTGTVWNSFSVMDSMIYSLFNFYTFIKYTSCITISNIPTAHFITYTSYLRNIELVVMMRGDDFCQRMFLGYRKYFLIRVMRRQELPRSK